MNYCVVGKHHWNEDLFDQVLRDLPGNWYYLEKLDRLPELSPRYVFFLHWSEWVPAEIYENYECVVFHPSDLPYGRGGTPIQNQIAEGKKATRLTAFRMTGELDAGPIYNKRHLSLEGSLTTIFHHEMRLAGEMIREIVTFEPQPEAQVGEVVLFTRRTPVQSEITGDTLQEVYNQIRMLDAAGYPAAYFERNGLRYEFHEARLYKDGLTAEVVITHVSY